MTVRSLLRPSPLRERVPSAEGARRVRGRFQAPHPAAARSRPPSPQGERVRRCDVGTLLALIGDARALRDADRRANYGTRCVIAASRNRRQVQSDRHRRLHLFRGAPIVEVDGEHAESSSDKRRDRWFADNGFLVIRFWNNDVLQNCEGVLISLLERLQENDRSSPALNGVRHDGHRPPAHGDAAVPAGRCAGAGGNLSRQHRGTHG